jgi:hypothetical protein
MGKAEDRLERLRKLESLKRIEAAVAAGSSRELAEVKEEGYQIVLRRERQLAEKEESSSPAPVEQEPEKPNPKRKRRRRRKSAVTDPVSTWGDEPAAVSAAQRNIDDALPDYTLRRDDGSEYTTTDPDVGPT